MKRFLFIAAATVIVAACSNTGGTEPLPNAANEVAKPGREQRITKTKRVNAPPGGVFNGDKQKYGLATAHGWTTENGRLTGYSVTCRDAPAICSSLGGDGTWIDINEGGVTTGTSSDPTTSTSNYLLQQRQ
ncbi:MAG: hypothetical protein FGM32_10005 [Candidatus Kapabacteria bacterium]|nr:hypothetical protein [Candidatus Kapabacteria bacterium]